MGSPSPVGAQDVVVNDWAELLGALEDPAVTHVSLGSDIVQFAALETPARAVTLDLNGRLLDVRRVEMASGGELTVTDDGTGRLVAVGGLPDEAAISTTGASLRIDGVR